MVYYGIVFLTVVLDVEPGNGVVCPGTKVVFTCATNSDIGFLRWRNAVGEQAIYDDTAFVGQARQFGNILGTNITTNVTAIETVSGRIIYISTATADNIMQDTTLWCGDGFDEPSRTVRLISSK